jgi:hypothetical protein
MPGDFGEYVPRTNDIEMPDGVFSDKPDFLVRSWNGNLAPELRREDALWRLHNKLSLDPDALIAIAADSSLRRYLPGKEALQEHPEYFARKADGSIDEHMVSFANPEIAKVVAQKVLARIAAERAKDPAFNSLGIAPDDGTPMDFSAPAMASSLGFADLGGREGVPGERSISEEWFGFMNRVAAEVAKEYPDFIITTNGYANRNTPPEGVTLHPNLAVMFAAIWSDLLHAYDDPKSWQQQLHGAILHRWTQLSPRVFVYGYNFPMLVTALTPMPLTRKIARNTRLAKEWGVIGFEDEQTFSWMAHGITSFYLRSRLYWHANADDRVILDDFYAKWYGPAASSSRAYWDAIEETLESTPLLGHEDRILPFVYTDSLIDALEREEAQSESVAVQEPYRTHVRVDRLILEHLRHYLAMSRADAAGDFAKALVEADAMFAARAELNGISPYFYWPESANPGQMYFSGVYYWTLTQRRAFYAKMLALTTGSTGELIARASSQAQFATDPLDVGRLERWQEPGFDRAGWRQVDTARPFYLQDRAWFDAHGVPYAGYMWYVFGIDVPANALGKPARLFASNVATEAWVWINGRFTGHRPYQAAYTKPAPLDFDATTQLKRGPNVIAIRVSTSQDRAQAAEGIVGPVFIYSPK